MHVAGPLGRVGGLPTTCVLRRKNAPPAEDNELVRAWLFDTFQLEDDERGEFGIEALQKKQVRGQCSDLGLRTRQQDVSVRMSVQAVTSRHDQVHRCGPVLL